MTTTGALVKTLLEGKCELANGQTFTADEARQELTKVVLKDMVGAAKKGNVDAVRWLEEHSKDALPFQDALTCIIEEAKKSNGNVDAVRWLEEHDMLTLEPH